MSAAPSTGVAPGFGIAATAEPAGTAGAAGAGCETEGLRVTILGSYWKPLTLPPICPQARFCRSSWPLAALSLLLARQLGEAMFRDVGCWLVTR